MGEAAPTGNGSSRDHARFPIRLWRIGSRLWRTGSRTWRIGSRLHRCDSTGRKTAQRPTAALKPTRRRKRGWLWRNGSRPLEPDRDCGHEYTPRTVPLYRRASPDTEAPFDATSEDDYGGTVRASAVPVKALNRPHICDPLHSRNGSRSVSIPHPAKSNSRTAPLIHSRDASHSDPVPRTNPP